MVPGDRPAPGDTLRGALRWYLVWNLVAVIAGVAGVIIFSGVLAREEALRDAQTTARAVAEAIVSPLADERFHAQDPEALARMNEAMDYRARDGSITHVKLWGDAGGGFGTVLWASQRPLVGKTFEMDPNEYALFGTTDMVASISDLKRPENYLERSAGQLVEVYTGMWDTSGHPIVFEVYVSMAGLNEDIQALTREILPLPLGVLVLLTMATLPLAISLAHRVDRGQQQMQRLLVNTVESTDLERRRIAQDLHDGVVQDLAGISYALSSGAVPVPADGGSTVQLDTIGTILKRDLESLRSLVGQIYPPDLQEAGLGEAIRGLSERVDLGVTQIHFTIDEPLTPRPLTARMAYRAIREILHNVAKHADASRVEVQVRQDGEFLRFEVADDGVGFDPQLVEPVGHLGMRLVAQMVGDAGGTLDVESEPGHGTTVRGSLPL
jgi:signal transduction histidine kinase